MVGCGAVGSYYGAKLARAGHEVHFLLRSDYQVVRRQGVFIRSPQGDFRVSPPCARSPEEIGPSELVIIALKTTANAELSRLLPPLVGPATTLLTLQNGLGNEERLANLFSPEQVMGGLCFVCLNRLEPGLIHHIDHGLVVVGEFQRSSASRTRDLAAMIRQAGVPCDVADNLAKAHWEKLTWNIPFNGLGVAGSIGYDAVDGAYPMKREVLPESPRTLTTDILLGDTRWARLVRELMLEIIAAGRALGFALEDSLADVQIQRTRSMGAYKASTLIDFERHQPLELDSLFLEPLRQAQQVGVPVPRLTALCNVLRQLDPASAG